MKTYKIQYKDGKVLIVEAQSVLEVIKKYDLTTRQNINTKIIELNK